MASTDGLLLDLSTDDLALERLVALAKKHETHVVNQVSRDDKWAAVREEFFAMKEMKKYRKISMDTLRRRYFDKANDVKMLFLQGTELTKPSERAILSMAGLTKPNQLLDIFKTTRSPDQKTKKAVDQAASSESSGGSEETPKMATRKRSSRLHDKTNKQTPAARDDSEQEDDSDGAKAKQRRTSAADSAVPPPIQSPQPVKQPQQPPQGPHYPTSFMPGLSAFPNFTAACMGMGGLPSLTNSRMMPNANPTQLPQYPASPPDFPAMAAILQMQLHLEEVRNAGKLLDLQVQMAEAEKLRMLVELNKCQGMSSLPVGTAMENIRSMVAHYTAPFQHQQQQQQQQQQQSSSFPSQQQAAAMRPPTPP